MGNANKRIEDLERIIENPDRQPLGQARPGWEAELWEMVKTCYLMGYVTDDYAVSDNCPENWRVRAVKVSLLMQRARRAYNELEKTP